MESKNKNRSVFETLSAINCNDQTERKNGLTYLSWAWAWQMVKQNYPDATYTIYENRDGLNYHHDGRTAWVKTGVTIEGIEMIEDLPVMDYRNASIPVEKLTSYDVNKAIQRSLTKACARHGLGLYIYAREDVPEGGETAKPQEKAKDAPVAAPKAKPRTTTPPEAKTPQKGSDEASALKSAAMAAWKFYLSLDCVRSMDANSRSKFFFAQLKTAVGKEDASKLTLAEWDKVTERIKAIKYTNERAGK